MRDLGSVPGWGRSPGGGHGNPLQWSCLENPRDRGAWQATVHGAQKSRTRLKWLSTRTHCLHSGCSQSTFQHQWRRVLISPHLLQPWFFVECLTMAILTGVRWYLIVTLIWISLVLSKVDNITCDFFFKEYEWNILQLTLERLPCVLMNTPRTFLEGRCCLLTTPRIFWILNAHQHSLDQHRFRRCCYGKWPQGGSIFHALFFSFSFYAISFWSYIGIELISKVVFV